MSFGVPERPPLDTFIPPGGPEAYAAQQERLEELAMAQIAYMSQPAPSGRFGYAATMVAQVVQRTPRITYVKGRQQVIADGLHFVRDASMPPHILAGLAVEARTLRLSAEVFEPLAEDRFVAHWFESPSSIDTWSNVIESSKLLRFLAAVQWVTFFKWDDLLAQAFNCHPVKVDFHPSAMSQFWRPRTMRVVAYTPLDSFTWQKWHGRYYSYLLRELNYFLVSPILVDQLTCRYFDIDYAPRWEWRQRDVCGPDLMRRVGLHKGQEHQAWDRYVRHLAEHCRVPRALVERRFRLDPDIRTSQEYLNFCSDLLEDMPELANLRRRAAEQVWPYWRRQEQNLGLWLAEPLTLLPPPRMVAQR